MVPIKNSIICLIIILNAIGITINYFLLYGKSFSSNRYSSNKDIINIVTVLYFLSIYFTFTIIFTFKSLFIN